MKRPGLIVALDDPDLNTSEALAKDLSGRAVACKVGSTLFGEHGPEAVYAIARHAPVFLDLKLHDIPAQVEKACSVLAGHGIWMLTVHGAGGREMFEAAVRGAGPSVLVAGVTVLTSMSESTLHSVGQGGDVTDQALRLGTIAVDCGARALICSGREVGALRAEFGSDVALVIPGVRPAGTSAEDQERVVTPSQAAAAGADYIVVGRPITKSNDPPMTADQILSELS